MTQNDKASSKIDTLRRIRDIALEICNNPGLSGEQPRQQSTISFTTPLDFNYDDLFPPPQSLAPSLVAIGLDANTAEQLSQAYCQAAIQLKDKCETHLRLTCKELGTDHDIASPTSLPDLQSQIFSVYTSQYVTTLRSWSDKVTEQSKNRVAEARRNVGQSSGGARRQHPFNHVRFILFINPVQC